MARQYAPALTQSQFRAIRPKGNYNTYLSYLERHRPGWKRPQAARPQHVNPPMRGPSYTYDLLSRRLQILTPQQMEAQANRMAQAGIKAQRGILNEEYKSAADDAMRRMLAFQSAGRMAAAMNANLIGQVGGQYQQGADALNAMAAAGAAQMSAATDAGVAAANQAGANVGAPPVVVGGPVGAPGIAGGLQAGVEQFYGGELGRQALENAGGYAQAGMAGQISSQNLRATQEAQAAYMAAMGEAGRNRARAVREIVSGRPAQVGQYLQQLQDNQRQAIALASSLIGAGFQQGMTKKEYTQKVKQQKVENQQWLKTFRENQRQYNRTLQETIRGTNLEMKQINTEISRATGYVVLNDGTVYKNPKTGKPMRVQGYGSTAGGGGLTAYQVSNLMPKAQELAEGLYSGYVTDAEGNRIPASQAPAGTDLSKATGQATYSVAMARLTRMGVPQATARAILNEYYQPTEGGRPPFTPEEARVLRKHYGPKHYKWFVDNIQKAAAEGDGEQVMRWYNLAMSGQNPGWKTLRR